ncbi:hypothetical protein GCM10022243_54980 [Saccharothrix violaceirubra]|uniref:Uncharacterized protein n=1 Tax=Saccharothrix violaceirubra TaxID=413306 RepID=A0A7W7T5P1_9PSEU|nr:hypothetical protein [Saccharothrix violaceirubra]MBB4967011.1 hypothetical protein [Saccharothrix violaceirubra]
MPERNEQLRIARERVESPSCPGEPLTRLELADLVNAHVYRATGKVTAVDANHVGKWERGAFRWPAAYYRNALRTVLDVGTDAELGFRRPARGKPDDVDRRALLKTALGASAGVVATRRLPGPAVDLDDLATAIMGPTAHYRRMESAVPSDQLAPAVDAHLRLASGIVASRMRNSTGYGVLSEIAGLSAWLAVDRDDHAAARKRYTEAVAHAERAHHPLLAAYMTASLGHFAVEAGHARQGVVLLDRAANQLDKSAPDSARAWLASLHAVGHAALGDRTATLIALRVAERLTSRKGGEPRWPWVFTFDRAKAARYQASALGRLGDLRAARDAFAGADPALSAAKPRALAQVDLAQVLAGAGMVDEGCRLALAALAVGRDYGSERITGRVRDFRQALPVRTRDAASLDDALTALYEGETG